MLPGGALSSLPCRGGAGVGWPQRVSRWLLSSCLPWAMGRMLTCHPGHGEGWRDAGVCGELCCCQSPLESPQTDGDGESCASHARGGGLDVVLGQTGEAGRRWLMGQAPGRAPQQEGPTPVCPTWRLLSVVDGGLLTSPIHLAHRCPAGAQQRNAGVGGAGRVWKRPGLCSTVSVATPAAPRGAHLPHPAVSSPQPVRPGGWT